MKRDSNDKLSPVTIALHWIVAVFIISLCVVGVYMTNWEKFDLYDIHKEMGIAAFVLIAARVVWRIYNGWPRPVGHYTLIEQRLSKATHWILMLCMVSMPVLGMMYSGFSGHGFGILGIELLPPNPSPLNSSNVIPISEYWSRVGQKGHQYVGYILIGFICLHVIGALKHHVFDKDRTILRMLGK